MTAKHIHIVSFDIPWPANYGGVIDVFYKVKALSEKGINVHLHCFEYGRAEANILEEICFSVNYYKRDVSKKHLFRSIPYIVSSRASEALAEKLLQDQFPILLEGLHTSQLLEDERFNNRRIVVRAHNVEHEYYLNLAKAEKAILKKYYFYNEAAKLKKYENILERADCIISISKKDEEYFNENFRHVAFIPAFHPHKEVKVKTGKGDYALYHGNLSVAENYNAAKYLITEVFDELKTPLKIAGLHPPAHLRTIIEQHPNVELIANPTDEQLFELIQDAHINISITFQATGLKLKLLNTLYNGRFCLVNDKMLSGSALDELCIVANDSSAMRKQIKALYKKAFLKKEIVRRCEKLGQMYHNGHNVDKLIELITGTNN